MFKSRLGRFILGAQARKLAGDGGMLLLGNGIASGLGFVTIAIVTRALGIDGLGLLVLCQTIISLVAASVLPKPWQALIRYGAGYKTRSEYSKLQSLVLMGFAIEIAASLMAYLFVRLGVNLWHIMMVPDPLLKQGILILSTTLLFQISGLPITVYRLFRRYRLQAAIEGINAMLLLLLVTGAYFMQAEVIDFILVYTVATICGCILNLVGAFYVMRSEGLLSKSRVKFRDLNDVSGIFSFGISMHFTDLVGTIMRQMDYLAIAYLLGPSGVGTTKILKQFSRPFSLLANPIKQVTYPDACELYSSEGAWAMVKYLSKVTLLLSIALTIILAPLLLAVPLILEVALGTEFVHLSMLVGFYVTIHVGFLIAQNLQVSALALGKATSVFYSYLLMNLVYILAILFFTPRLEIAGVVWAFAVGAVVWAIWLMEVNRRELKHGTTQLNPGDHISQATSR